jgi:hypothetical protein
MQCIRFCPAHSLQIPRKNDFNITIQATSRFSKTVFPHQNIAIAHCKPLNFPDLVALSYVVHITKCPVTRKARNIDVGFSVSFHIIIENVRINPHNRYLSSIYLISFPDNEHYLECGIFVVFFPVAQKPLEGQGLRTVEVSRSPSDTPQSAELLWTSDQSDV